MNPLRIVLAYALASFALLSGGAGAQVVTEFSAGNGGAPPPITAEPADITAGPDGNLWFTKRYSNWIWRITPAGVVTEFIVGTGCKQGKYPVPPSPSGITAGPDGNLWFTEFPCGWIGRMTPQGAVTEFSAGITSVGNDITAGPDGNVWFTELSGRIGRITPAGVITEFSAGITGIALGITTGPDGNLWFTEAVRSPPDAPTVGWIGRITPAGVVTEFSAGITDGAWTGNITAGPDGNLWFTESVPSPFPAGPVGRIGRITPQGVVTEFSAGITGVPAGITAGPDGNVWFTEGDRIGQITPAGVVTEFSILAGYADDIAAGPDGNLWFTDSPYNRIGRITTSGTLPGLDAVSASPSSVVGGNPSTGTVTLTAAAPASGVVVSLSSANHAVQVPDSVSVPPGASSASFGITTFPVPTQTLTTLSASYGGVTVSTIFTVNPPSALPALATLALNPASVAGGTSATGTVTLTAPAPSGGTVVNLASSKPALASVPASVTVAEGATSAAFNVAIGPTKVRGRAAISASYSGVTKRATITVTPGGN